jgi:hypothetical protein
VQTSEQVHVSAVPHPGNTGRQYIGTLVYLAYGNGPHIQEAVFSLLTAAHFEPFGTGRIRYVVYTDQPEAFSTLEGVTLIQVDQAKLDEWLEGSDYIHRRKPMAMIEALEAYKGKLAFIDSDTCFQRSPARIFDRIGPGRSCLHLMENTLRLTDDASAQMIWDSFDDHPFTWSDGTKAALSGDSEMWNSGVTGFDYSDIGVLREGLRFSDHLWTHSRAHNCEQFAIGIAARRMTSVSATGDIVFHYWPGFLKEAFRAQLADTLPAILALPPLQRPEAAFKARAKATPLQWLKQTTKYALRRMGRPTHGLLRSA